MTPAKAEVEIRSAAGDPIQLADLHPVACASLARVGNVYDGGYVVPLEAVQAADALLSFGLSHNWAFERDFKSRKPSAVIHCYDHTVSLRTAFNYSVGQLARCIALFRGSAFGGAFAWIDYLRFFRGGNIHFKQRVWYDRQNNSATIDDAFGRLPANSPVFVKMDIEGSEYRVLDDLLRRSQDITAMAIEFHDVDILPGLFNAMIEKIKQDFYIVHIHGNNMGGTTPFHFPISPEITFLNKRFFRSVPPLSPLKYPVPGLDSPNHPRLPEFAFEF
jgi:FkbM family methyltransferase